MKLTVNGKSYDHKGDGKLLSLLEEMGADPKQVAVALNDDIVSRTDVPDATLCEDDRVEILTLAAGG